MTYEQLVETIDGWLQELRHQKTTAPAGARFHFEKRGGDDHPEAGRLTFCTATQMYSINFHDNYLGCGASCRTARPGETWLRGNDLPDGKFSRETWDKILLGILGYELVALDVPAEPILVSSAPANTVSTS